MVPLGRRIWKVPTWLAMRADWVVVARRTGPQRPAMRSALAVLAVKAVQFAPGTWSIRAAC
jgi:hypothetical protein